MKRFLIIALLLACSTSFAEEYNKTFGDWGVSVHYEGGVAIAIANTQNDSGSVLGVLCFNEGCTPYTNFNLSCSEDRVYPALVSTDSGFTPITMNCTQLGGHYLFSLPEDQIEYLLSDNQYGIAFGLANGKFKAAYFSLNGSTKAIIEVKRLLELLSPSLDNSKPKYKDTTL